MFIIEYETNFGNKYYYDKAFDTYFEAAEFLKSIGGKRRVIPNLIGSCDEYFWYDKTWNIRYWILEDYEVEIPLDCFTMIGDL